MKTVTVYGEKFRYVGSKSAYEIFPEPGTEHLTEQYAILLDDNGRKVYARLALVKGL
jgi:hypothetical protein